MKLFVASIRKYGKVYNIIYLSDSLYIRNIDIISYKWFVPEYPQKNTIII